MRHHPHFLSRLTAATSILISAASIASAQPTPTTPPALATSNAQAPPAESPADREARMRWWREARFGMFVHWGLYSGLAGSWNGQKVSDHGGMEWIQSMVGADSYSYAAQAIPKFTPTKDFAKQWATLAKNAGCQYVVFTTKHHEGFALHDSKFTDFDAGDLLNRDLVKEITDALHAEHIRVGFYHSLIDWHHPQYDFSKAPKLPYPKNAKALATTPRNHERYIQFLHNQVNELVSNYGTVDILWWDYSSIEFQGDAAWHASDLQKLVRSKQPNIIMNNRLYRIPEAGFNGMGTHNVTNRLNPQYGDFVTPEQHIPDQGLPGVDWESCMTLNTSWGFNQHDHQWKSSETIIRNLIDIASKGGNYLINIGPTGDGSIPPQSSQCLNEVGTWLQKHSKAIYATSAAPANLIPTAFDGRATRRGNSLFLFLFRMPDPHTITLPCAITSASWLHDGSPLTVTTDNGQSSIRLPDALPFSQASVIQIDLPSS